MHLPLRAIAVFHTAARAGSVSRAAQDLGVTPPAVGQQIAALEIHLGTSLTVKSGRHMALTEAGERYFEMIAETIDRISEATQSVRGHLSSGSLAGVFKPVSEGGRLPRSGLVDIAASHEPDGRVVFNNIQYGVFVTFRANNEYTRDCLKQYGLLVDRSGWCGSMWRPFHLIGLETSVSVPSAVLRGEPTGTPKELRGDAVATAKRDLRAGETLDGEGGYTVWANAIPAARSLAARALPIGLAHNARLRRAVAKDAVVSMDDVELDRDLDVVELRREVERAGTPPAARVA